MARNASQHYNSGRHNGGSPEAALWTLDGKKRSDAACEIFRPGAGHSKVRRCPLGFRVSSGCFHREHSPYAYELIDKSLGELSGSEPTFGFEEHESGPEILAYVVVGVGLAKAVIELITAIIKAEIRRDTQKRSAFNPLEVIVRRVYGGQEFREEKVLRVGHTDAIDEAKIEQQLTAALRKLLKESAKPIASGDKKKKSLKKKKD